jgi:hypothetical protein
VIERSHLSLEYVEAEVTATTPDGQPIDPAELSVQLAFVPVGTDPSDTDWHAAEHLRGDIFGVLVGPTALALDRGDYDAWHDTTDNPERPVAPFGKLRIF